MRSSDGTTKQLTAAETTLNWQSENALAQNTLLRQIASNQENFYQQTQQNLSIMESAIQEIHQKMTLLHHELLHLATTGESNLYFPRESSCPRKDEIKQSSSSCLMIQDSSSNDVSLSPVMMVGVSPQEDEVGSEAENSTLEQTTQPHVEFPPEATPYIIGSSQQSFSLDKIPPSEWRDKV
ncbi:hypothetical protein LIER_24803 [Lithospermum erythrorhizon]|uniref:Uncharacterized protein n=1 Tax=Lithospermum erythrorhizon TaxID=34254 RepID=A0AAV3R2M2_LITER